MSKFRNFFLSSILIFTSLCTTFIKRSWSPLTESQWLLCIVFHLYCFPLVLFSTCIERSPKAKTPKKKPIIISQAKFSMFISRTNVSTLSSNVFLSRTVKAKWCFFFASRLASGQPVLSSHPANPHG